jgi:hypothetical protein
MAWDGAGPRWPLPSPVDGRFCQSVVSLLSAQGSVGWPPVSGLKIVGSASELVQGEPEGSCDAVGNVPGGVSHAALETTDGGGVEVRRIGKSLLGQSDLFAA